MDIAAGLRFIGSNTGTSVGRKTAAPESVVMKLEPYRVALLQARGPVEITCMSGQLWLTFPGETEDFILQAGQSMVLSRPARDVLLSTAGAQCPASFGIRRSTPETGRHWLYGVKPGPHFQVEFV